MTGMRIEPGIYRDMSANDYFADPATEPSLTQSIAKIILDQSPLHAMYAHPRLMPPETDDEEEKYVKAQAIGNAAHALMIGRGKELAVAQFDSWRSKDAKEFRDEAEAAGKTVILDHHLTIAADMVNSARAQIAAHDDARDTFAAGGYGEIVYVWEEDGLWFRTMIDWLHEGARIVDDYKTTGMSVAPYRISNLMVDAGWDIQAAMQERALNRFDPAGTGRRRFRFIAQENWKPYALTINELPEAVMTMGRKKLDMAITIWRGCIETRRWPGYPPKINRPSYPTYKEMSWLNRELEFADAGIVPGGYQPTEPSKKQMLTDLSAG